MPHLTVRRSLLLVAVASLLLLAVQGARAVRAATAGEQHLATARVALKQKDIPKASTELAAAQQQFTRARSALRWAGPAGELARITPLARVQYRAAVALTDAGGTAARAGLALMPVATQLTAPGRSATDAVRDLSAARPTLDRAVADLDRVGRRLREFDSYRLVWPLNRKTVTARNEVVDATEKANAARHGLRVLLDVSGADGPRRYLVLSQNPDEVRPTGGYMGTYGLLTGNRGTLKLVEYGASGDWSAAHPQAALPPAQAPFPFRYVQEVQDLPNTNTLPDWPSAARLAARIWERGKEPPVDGVLTFTPALLSRLVGVLGPTRVPGYPDTITAQNLEARLDFYTHGAASRGKTNAQRKQFVADLAQVVLTRLVQAPTGRLPDLLQAVSAGMDAGDGAIWSTRTDVQRAVEALDWDGGFTPTDADVYVDAEFAFASKNGRRLLRTFTHTVTLQPDGSGISATKMLLRNTAPYDAGNNPDSLAYLTPYGPRGGTLDPSSDKPDHAEPDLAGHPTAGWLRAAPPLGTTTLNVVWRAPALAVQVGKAEWEYRLTFRPTPGHRGDVLRLDVRLPAGARWLTRPPSEVALTGPYEGRWRYRTAPTG